jgi:hypothetical protein
MEEGEPIKLTINYQPNNKSKVKTPISQNNPRNIYPNLLILLKISPLVSGTNPQCQVQILSNPLQIPTNPKPLQIPSNFFPTTYYLIASLLLQGD